MPTSWTDDPIVPGGTPIKAQHINELRTAVNSLRQSAGLHQVSWTDSPVVAGATRIRAVHFNEVTGAIQDLWFRRSLGRLPSWSAGSPPSPSRTIRASDMNNLRSWVNTYEAAIGLDPQGIDSLTFDPNPPGTAIITQEWVDDAINLGEDLPSQNRLLIRANIKSRESDNFIVSFFPKYKEALELWINNGFSVATLFTPEFDRWEKIDNSNPDYQPNHVLDELGGQANKYILHYSGTAGQFANYMKSTGHKTFWIWNEPDIDQNIDPGVYTGNPKAVSPEVYGALLYQTSYAIRSEIPDATIYAGAFSLQHDAVNWQANIQRVETFLDRMYTYMNQHGMSVSSGQYGYGWNALSVNIEGIFDSTYPQAMWEGLTGKQKAWGDTPSIVVGEWGTQNGNFSVGDGSILSMYLGIRLFFPTMYFFSHQWANEASPTHRSYGTMDSSNVDTSDHTYVLGSQEDWYSELHDKLYPRP